MQISDLVFNVAILFVMMLPGVILKRCKMVTDGFGKGLSNLILYIAQPALILYAYLSCKTPFGDIWYNVLAVFIISVAAHLLFSVVTLLLFRGAEDGMRRMLRFATIFSNAAFMGIPLIQTILGSEAAIYASIYNITFNFFLWTLGVWICTEGKDEDDNGIDDYHDIKMYRKKNVSVVKVLLHPVTLASVIGFLLLVFGVNIYAYDFWIIDDCILSLKNLVAPLSMVVIGLRIVDVDFSGILTDKYMYLSLALRHLALPALVILFIKCLALLGMNITNEVLLTGTLMAAAPAATSATMFAEKYGCDAKYVSRLVTVSTLLSIATMPLMVAFSDLLM